MAHPVCGIDIGAFSIKFVVFDVGFRQNVFRGAFEELVSDGPAPLQERQIEALREGLTRVSSDAMLYVAMPGDALSIRALELPFTDPRKIDQVIGFELEGQIVHALEEVVFDHVTVRSSAEGSSVLAVAAKQTDVAAFLEALQGGGVDPRSLYAAPVVYRALPIDDPRCRCPDIRRAEDVLGWKPKVSLAKGLAKTIAYFDELLQQERSIIREIAA